MINSKIAASLFANNKLSEDSKEALLYLNMQGLFLDNSIFEDNKESIPPSFSDLARLHKIIRERKIFTILEFGVGWSTLVMADALLKNKYDWESNKDINKNVYLKENMFQLHSVDTSETWIKATKNRLPTDLKNNVSFYLSNVQIGEWHGRVCHYYEKLPDILPDFIYLDGPDPRDVKGEIGGITFNTKDRHVMSADLLKIETLFLPRTMILVDGRVSNSRFLALNFYRNWNVEYNSNSDVTVFELIENAIGKKNEKKIKYQLDQ